MHKKIIFVVIVVLVLGAGMLWSSKNSAFLSNSKCQMLNTACSWYAVHLSNNQIYFGHIVSATDSTIILSDTYFFESYQEPVSKALSKNFALEQAPQQSFRLVKRGDEKILSSDHTLFINRAEVLYWEKLTPESETVKLLEEKENGKRDLE